MKKNNFLMELYLKNEDDRSKMFDDFDLNLNAFIQNSDSSYQSKKKFYSHKKEDIKWSDDFDLYAKSMLDFHHFTKKEIYPMAHKMRTGENVTNELPVNYYNYRSKIDFNNKLLTNYSPFVKYLTHMLNNVAFTNIYPQNLEEEALELHIQKLNIADTLFKNESIKNKIIDNIAFSYLLEDQNIDQNKKFLIRYNQLSTDNSNLNEINKIGESIQLLKKGNDLPEVTLVDITGKTTTSKSLLNQKTVFFFWTENAESHLVAVHKKVLEFQRNNPEYQFIAVNIDEEQDKWLKVLENHSFGSIKEFRAENFEDLKEKWVITKLHRTLIIDETGKISNGFVNLFDVKFAENLK